jgi:hypothetical protein
MRAATGADAAALARLRRASHVELGLLAPSTADGFERAAVAEFASLFGEGRLAARLLVCEGEILGCASVLFWRRLPYASTSLHADLAACARSWSIRATPVARCT